jgi:hypothetical protein
MILSCNGCGDITSHSLLLRITAMVIFGLFWRQNFVVGRHTKVVVHSLSLSLLGSCHISKLKQQSDDHPMRKESV